MTAPLQERTPVPQAAPRRAAMHLGGVHRHFDGVPVLRGLTLTVNPGEVVALLGRNGAGKTTALRVLLGFLEPHQGYAKILGVDSTSLTPQHRERIGYVTEGHKIDPLMRVSDVLAFEAATRSGFDRDWARASIKRIGLRDHQLVALLSRGQRAQLAVVTAVAVRPDVLVFDDPAMGLDVAVRREFLDVLIDLLGERGTAVLFSSHILTDVERIADRIALLHGGGLIVDAHLHEIKERVEVRTWRGEGSPPIHDRVLAARQAAFGHDLTLLDSDDALVRELQSSEGSLSAPRTPDLEELFLALTTDGKSMLAPMDLMEDER